MRAPIVGSLVFVFSAVIASACNTAPPVSFDTTAFTSSAIQNGSVDTGHPYAVGVCAGNGPGACNELCSGTLIAPNVVLTARHCIDSVPNPNAVNCQTDSFGGQIANQYWVTTYYQLLQGSQGWHQVIGVTFPPNKFICGNDLAILELANNVSPGEATPVEPVGQYPMTDHVRYKTTQTAIGFGKTSVSINDAGTRHILQSIKVVCIPGDKVIDCGVLDPKTLDANEYVAGDGTCPGDSGSGGYEQTHFNANTPVSMGVLSRGGQSGNNCVGSVYTRTDVWHALIVQAVTKAAADGGYAVPAWTQPAPPEPDASLPPDSSVITKDGSVPQKTPLGGTCNSANDCMSNDCESFDDGVTFVCTQACNATTACPSNFTCDRGFCRSGTVDAGPPATSTVSETSGCTTNGSGGNWGAIVIAALAIMAGTRRKKKSP